MFGLYTKIKSHDRVCRAEVIRYSTDLSNRPYAIQFDFQHSALSRVTCANNPPTIRRSGSPSWLTEPERVSLLEGECVMCVSQFYAQDKSLVGLQLVTNLGRTTTIGKSNGIEKSDQAPRGSEVVAVELKRSSTAINHVRVVFRSMPTMDKLRGRFHRLKRASDKCKVWQLSEQLKQLMTSISSTIEELNNLSEREIVSVGCLVASLLKIVHRTKNEVAPWDYGILTNAGERSTMLQQIEGDLVTLRRAITRYNLVEIKSCVEAPSDSNLLRRVAQKVTRDTYEALMELQAKHPSEAFELGVTDNLFAYFTSIGDVEHFAQVAKKHAVSKSIKIQDVVRNCDVRMPVTRVAIACGHSDMLIWLLSHSVGDPEDLPRVPLGKLSLYVTVDKIDLDQSIEHLLDRGNNNQAVRIVLDQARNRREFVHSAIRLLKRKDAAKKSELVELLHKMTVVWHLPWVYTLGRLHLHPDQLESFLRMGVNSILDNGLIAGNKALCCFTGLLKQAVQQGVLNEGCYDSLIARAEASCARSTAEGANAGLDRIRSQLREIRDVQLPSIRSELAFVRQAVMDLQAQNVHHDRHERQLALVSALLSAAGIPGLELLSEWLDISNPMHLLCSMASVEPDRMTNFVVDPSSELVLRDGVKSALDIEFGVEAEPFARALRSLDAPSPPEQKSRFAELAISVIQNQRHCNQWHGEIRFDGQPVGAIPHTATDRRWRVVCRRINQTTNLLVYCVGARLRVSVCVLFVLFYSWLINATTELQRSR